MQSSPRVIVIGSGFAGLSAATQLAHKGYDVTILEKNSGPGGRARVFSAEGYVFDMGPSWYWMPDIFENYFARYGKTPADYYKLIRLDPSYKVIFDAQQDVDLPADMQQLRALFESMESGSAARLDEFLRQAAYKYDVGINNFVWKPSRKVSEFLSLKLLYDVTRLDVFQSFSSHVRKFFKDPRLLQLIEFPILFLGATAEKTPAMYSLMNYAEMTMGTWYPMGGMHELVKGMVKLAEEKGVKMLYNQKVTHIEVKEGLARRIETDAGIFEADVVVAGADYHHVDSQLLDEPYQNYDKKYWDSRTMAPSSLLYYLGVNKRVPKLLHHNLFFDEDFTLHADEIYENPKWPSKPLFYVSAPSKTDPTVAPEGCENLFVLIPVAPGLTDDTEAVREKYYNLVMERLEAYVGEPVRPHVTYKRSYAHRDFIQDYNAFKGNAYGLANTLKQTAILKPGLKNKKVGNLYYTGQLTVPGPGVPPSLISGLVVAEEVAKEFPL
ncbi:phytoene desaturase family protein [Arundinibacter roseus]|uniref:Phytoene desaturase n=1 Tax=Arundinibacter roseus TaxID=2070510 RepID=A0A4R4KL50_9BACT|nr:phytoene desaturase family protein [Arundinibacter roseus]TDB69067.1 phytoene desaturase [Arundinibacter roseus]